MFTESEIKESKLITELDKARVRIQLMERAQADLIRSMSRENRRIVELETKIKQIVKALVALQRQYKR